MIQVAARVLTRQASRQAGKLAPAGLAAAYALLASAADPQGVLVEAAGAAQVAGSRARSLEPLTKRLERVGPCLKWLLLLFCTSEHAAYTHL